MGPDSLRRCDLHPEPSAVPIDREEVRRLAGCGPDPKWDSWIDAAVEEARSLMEPRARTVEVPPGEVGGLFSGETPVSSIARAGACWAFVTTLGPRLERRVEVRFQSGHAVEGLFLDAAGSSGVEGLCDLAEHRCGESGSTARFSPGYCAWELADQRRLLTLLDPGDLGVRLLPSTMMRPVKSVAGLVVRGDPALLEIAPEVCASCDAAGCTRRQAGGATP